MKMSREYALLGNYGMYILPTFNNGLKTYFIIFVATCMYI